MSGMSELRVAVEVSVRTRTGEPPPTEDLHAMGEKVMQALLALERVHPGVRDAATSSDAERGVVVAELVIAGQR